MNCRCVSRSIAIVVLGLILGVSWGCQSGGSSSRSGSRGAILEQWGERISSIGLVAIMPLEEDVRVGDIYAFSISPDQLATGSGSARQAAAKHIAASSRWASLPVLTDLGDEYARRPSWPRTPDEFVGRAGPAMAWQEPDTDSGTSIFAPKPIVTRLRIVGLDHFAAVSFSGSDLETMIPTEAATLIAGTADPRTMAVTLRAGSAESYSLSLDRVISLLLDDATGDGGSGFVLKQPYRQNLEVVADPVTGRVWLQVISEVVYIRSADITVRTFGAAPKEEEVTAEELAKVVEKVQQSSTTATAAALAQPTAETDAPAQPAAVDTPGTALVAYAATKLDPLYGAFVRAQAINEVLANAVGDDVPGSLVHFISVTDESVALRRLWPRGLAVGVRGLTLEVDAATGQVLRSGPMGQPLPSMIRSATGP